MKDISTKSLEGVTALAIVWDKNTSHTGLLGQIVDKVAASGFASHKEIVEEWRSILALEDVTNQP